MLSALFLTSPWEHIPYVLWSSLYLCLLCLFPMFSCLLVCFLLIRPKDISFLSQQEQGTPTIWTNCLQVVQWNIRTHTCNEFEYSILFSIAFGKVSVLVSFVVGSTNSSLQDKHYIINIVVRTYDFLMLSEWRISDFLWQKKRYPRQS